MPRKRKGSDDNKSELIRQAFDSLGSGARARDVLKILADQGHEVSRALVSNVLKRHLGGIPVGSLRSGGAARSGKKAAKKRGRPVAAPAVKRGAKAAKGPKRVALPAPSLKAAKKFVSAVGGINKAKKILDIVADMS